MEKAHAPIISLEAEADRCMVNALKEAADGAITLRRLHAISGAYAVYKSFQPTQEASLNKRERSQKQPVGDI